MTNKSVKGTLISHLSGYADQMNGISTISNCINNIDIDGSKFTTGTTYISGIVRDVNTSGSYCVITNSINNGNITSTFRTAGIVSYVTNSTTLLIENNLNTGTIKSTFESNDNHASAGGILAYLLSGTATLKNNINLGKIENIAPSQTAGVGGIIGFVNASSAAATNLYNNINSGSITAKSTTVNTGNAGGIIGFAGGIISLFNNINTGTVESKGIYAGGAIGRADTSSIVTLDGNLNYGKKVF